MATRLFLKGKNEKKKKKLHESGKDLINEKEIFIGSFMVYLINNSTILII